MLLLYSAYKWNEIFAMEWQFYLTLALGCFFAWWNIGWCAFPLQDNVFVQLICTIQYRVVKEHADDAFYELQNPQQQIQAYVFDGKIINIEQFSCCS